MPIITELYMITIYEGADEQYKELYRPAINQARLLPSAPYLQLVQIEFHILEIKKYYKNIE